MLRKDNDEMAQEMQELRARAERDSREMQSMKRLRKENEDDARRKLDDLDMKNTKLSAELARVSAQYKQGVEKGASIRELEERSRQLEADNRLMKA